MPYLRLDDNVMEHPKMERLSDPAFRIWMRGLTYCARLMTDGFIPRRLALSWGSLKRIGELMAAGLWDEAVGGYRVHDYLDWNESRERILERRRADSLRKKGGIPDRNPSGVPGVGVGEGKESKEAFARFWAVCPRREMEQACRSLFRSLVADGVDAEEIVAGMEAYHRSVKDREPRFVASPLRWLEGARWRDEYEVAPTDPRAADDEIARLAAELRARQA